MRLKHVPASEDNESARYEVESRGYLPVRPGSSPVAEARIYDITRGDPQPVVALLDWQQRPDSILFGDRTTFGYWSGQFLGSDDWVSLRMPIWPEMLRAPYSGARTLEVDIAIFHEFDDDEYFYYHELHLSETLSEIGWREFSERRAADEVAAIRLAMGVAAASGALHESELSVIKHWATEQVAFLDPDEQQEPKERLNEAIRSAARHAADGQVDFAVEIDFLLEEGTQGGRLEAIELCLSVAKADGVAGKDELERINRMATRLGVDRGWFSEVRDKSLRGIAIQSGGTEDLAALLGIDRNASPEETRQELIAQYDRWSSRAVSLDDPELRTEAEQMLEVIARAREELL